MCVSYKHTLMDRQPPNIKKRRREKQKENRENNVRNGNTTVSRKLIFDKITLLEDDVAHLKQIQDEDREEMMKKLDELKKLIIRTATYFDVKEALGIVSNPNDLKY